MYPRVFVPRMCLCVAALLALSSCAANQGVVAQSCDTVQAIAARQRDNLTRLLPCLIDPKCSSVVEQEDLGKTCRATTHVWARSADRRFIVIRDLKMCHLEAGPHDARFVHGVIEQFEAKVTDGWACWSLGNHDIPRVATRWRHASGGDAAWLRLAFAMQATLRGSPCVYQGEELGLTEADIAFEDVQDPYGITMWPEYRGRDGCRTPMVWDAAAPQGGFSTAARTWLPVAPEHLPLAAAGQRGDAGSLLNFYRAMLAWRRSHPGLQRGGMQLLPAHDQVLAFVRDASAEHGPACLCAFNMSAQPAVYTLPPAMKPTLDTSHPLPGGTCIGDRLELPPFGAVFATL